MKNYRQLIKGLPPKTVIMTVGSFNPPTSVNEMAFKLVDKLVKTHNADHVIYITEDKDNLHIDRKLHFLELMFGAMNFKSLNESNMTAELIRLKSKYKEVIVVAPEDKAKLYESLQVITTESDIDHSKIKTYVTKGDFTAFKKAMPTTLRELDARRLMNEMRQVSGLELLKEEVKFSVDTLRDKYFKGEIYHVGDIVESAGQQYEIMDRGSNYLVVVNNTGDLSRKWVKDVSLIEAKSLDKACWKGYKAIGLKKKNGKSVPNCVPEEVKEEVDTQVSYKGYTTKNMQHCCDMVKSFKLVAVDAKDPVAMLNAIKTTDTYLDLHNERGDNPSVEQLKTWKHAHIKAKEALQKIGTFDANQEHWLKSGELLDKMLAPHGIKENFEVDKTSNYNIARSVMSYQDFMKLKKMATPENTEKYVGEPQTTPGHTLATRHHLRRQKVAYVNENVVQGDMMDEDFSNKFVSEGLGGNAENSSGEVGDEIGNDKIAKIKPLPPELSPTADAPGKEKNKGFSAFYEKKKKVEKEALDYLDLDSWLRQQSPQAHG